MAVSSSNHTQALLEACAEGDLQQLRSLLDDSAVSSEALSEVDSTGRGKTQKIINLRNLVQTAAKAGHATIVSYLFAFARENSVNSDALVGLDTLLAALSTSRVDVMAEFVEAQPSCVNMSLGYSGDPLARAIIGSYLAMADDTNPETRVPLVQYLLEHGADPNQHACGFFKPGFHLHTATARGKPIEMIRLLLDHGAQVRETGALVSAAERGRVDVLELLLAHGADVNEPLTEGVFHDYKKEERERRAREKPIEAARRTGQETAVRWLQLHGAE